MDEKNFRKMIQCYITSMTFFEKLFDEKILEEKEYEVIETTLAFKYGLDPNSVIRDKYKKL